MKSIYLPALLRLPRLSMGPERERVSAYTFEHHMDQVYLPAILPTTLYDKWGLRPMNWMDERLRGTEAYYPYALLSYYHWRGARTSFPDDAHIFGDSGGYSVATLGANLDPMAALKWQQRNCDVGVLLDVPPYVNVGTAVLGGNASSNWEEALRKSVNNTERVVSTYLRGEGDFKWWGVIHGETWGQMQEWYDRISAIYPFDGPEEGWAMKPHPANDPRSVARCLGFARKVGLKRVHFLQMTGIPAVTTLFHLGPQAGLEYATYDSATPSFAGINRAVFQPSEDGMTYSPEAEKYREGETHARDWMVEKCPCISCEFMREDLEENPEHDWRVARPENDEYGKYRMIFHNTLALLQILRRREEEISEELFRETLSKRLGSTLRAFTGEEAHSVSLGRGIPLGEELNLPLDPPDPPEEVPEPPPSKGISLTEFI